MKLVDILLVLTAATVNAILIPTNNDGSLQASGTSSQVSGSTDEPNSDTFDQNWQEIMDELDLNLSDQDWQEIINAASSSTPNQDQQQPINVVDPSTSRRGRKRPIDELGPSISEQDWKAIIDKPDPGIPEDWRDLIDAINSKNSREYWQQPIDRSGPSTSRQDQRQPIDVVGPSTSKRSRRQPIDQPSPITFSQVSGSTHEPNPSIFNQGQQQQTDGNDSANTSSNQVTELSRRDQITLDRIKQRLVAFKKVRKENHKKHHEYIALGINQKLALAMGEEISESRHNPNTEDQLKQEYEKASRKVYNVRQRLKDFMAKHGLRFEEPN
ncbi:hypothetical protein O5D80_001824 [Batrachochytrium dendrobatidis]|nr:hypothetical protein O5D80_001824 [Batrachochytrium dendrobatidis]